VEQGGAAGGAAPVRLEPAGGSWRARERQERRGSWRAREPIRLPSLVRSTAGRKKEENTWG
jgi:hypothetical protein